LSTTTPRSIAPSVIALPSHPVRSTRARIIATAVEIIASEVDACGAGVASRVVAVALTVDVVQVCTAVGRTEVAVAIRMHVAVLPQTRAGTSIVNVGESAEITRG